MWEVSENTPANMGKIRRGKFFYNRQGRRKQSIRGQRATKSSFQISAMKSFTIYYANSFKTHESGTLIT